MPQSQEVLGINRPGVFWAGLQTDCHLSHVTLNICFIPHNLVELVGGGFLKTYRLVSGFESMKVIMRLVFFSGGPWTENKV